LIPDLQRDPSYRHKHSGGPENEFTQRNTTFINRDEACIMVVAENTIAYLKFSTSIFPNKIKVKKQIY